MALARYSGYTPVPVPGELLCRHHNNMTDNRGFTGEVRYWHGLV